MAFSFGGQAAHSSRILVQLLVGSFRHCLATINSPGASPDTENSGSVNGATKERFELEQYVGI